MGEDGDSAVKSILNEDPLVGAGIMRESSSVTTLGFFNGDEIRARDQSVTETVMLGDDELSLTNPNVHHTPLSSPVPELPDEKLRLSDELSDMDTISLTASNRTMQ